MKLHFFVGILLTSFIKHLFFLDSRMVHYCMLFWESYINRPLLHAFLAVVGTVE